MINFDSDPFFLLLFYADVCAGIDLSILKLWSARFEESRQVNGSLVISRDGSRAVPHFAAELLCPRGVCWSSAAAGAGSP